VNDLRRRGNVIELHEHVAISKTRERGETKSRHVVEREGLIARLACVIDPAPLLIVENDLRGSFVELKLGTHFLDLRRLLFEARGNSFFPSAVARLPPESPSAAGPL